MALGDKIHILREDRNLSQKELANLAGVTTGVIAEWEADETAPNLAELARLCKALNVSSDILLEVTTEDIVPSVPVQKQEPKPVIVPAKEHKKTGLIVGIVAGIVVVLIGASKRANYTILDCISRGNSAFTACREVQHRPKRPLGGANLHPGGSLYHLSPF